MVMVKSAIKKSRRKSQREAARVQRQTDAALAMEEDEEILFKRPKTVPNTPRASRSNTPDPHSRIRQELLDAGGNLRARDIGISWQDGETFLHGVRITGQRDRRTPVANWRC